MSRKSSAALAIITPIPGQRPAPPKSLAPDEASVWKQVVATKPADWFTPDSWPMLEAYCVHTVAFRDLQDQVRALPKPLPVGTIPLQDKLYAMRERESRAITALARSMRITQQARYRGEVATTAHKQAAGDGTSLRPWDASQ